MLEFLNESFQTFHIRFSTLELLLNLQFYKILRVSFFVNLYFAYLYIY